MRSFIKRKRIRRTNSKSIEGNAAPNNHYRANVHRVVRRCLFPTPRVTCHSLLIQNRNMHTVWVRLNAVVFFGLTVLLSLSCLAAFSKIGHAKRHQPVVNKLQLNQLRSLKSHGGVDRALLSFDIDADLTPAFHWNIKQLFVYVVASYTTDTNPNNQIVLWDKIIEATDPPSKKTIQQNNVFVKYALVDQKDDLRGKRIKLTLMWDHMPITGTLYMGGQEAIHTTSFYLPDEYQ